MFSVFVWTLAWTFIRQAAEQKRIHDEDDPSTGEEFPAR